MHSINFAERKRERRICGQMQRQANGLFFAHLTQIELGKGPNPIVPNVGIQLFVPLLLFLLSVG